MQGSSEHLKTLSEICRVFGRGRETVLKWYSEGAPIACDGVRYFTEYNRLLEWLLERGKYVKKRKIRGY